MSAKNDTYELMHRIFKRANVLMDFDAANTLRRAQITLHRWSEMECGDSNVSGSWVIERDDVGEGPPYMVRHHYRHGVSEDIITRTRIPDKEKGALRRVVAVCKAHGLHYYHQTDPRGCALYVSNEPLPENDYTRGIACCA